MKLLTWILGAFIVVYWVAFLVAAGLVLLVFWQLLRPFMREQFAETVPPAAPSSDDLDVVQEGLLVPSTEKGLLVASTEWPANTPIEEVRLMPAARPDPLFCITCGHRTWAPANAPLPGPCVDCGGTRWGYRADLPILGEPKELRP